MFYNFNNQFGKGLDKRDSSPRLVGDIIKEMFLSNSPLAKGYRRFLALQKSSAEKGGEL
jgi:hypothetical protein